MSTGSEPQPVLGIAVGTVSAMQESGVMTCLAIKIRTPDGETVFAVAPGNVDELLRELEQGARRLQTQRASETTMEEPDS